MNSSGFERDLDFLRRHTEVVVLEGRGGERVAVTPAWQGKTMTSTVGGSGAPGFGWLNEAFISSGRVDPQANLHGGEDRFWIGPEGGQFAFYFEPGKPFDFASWCCPALIDRQPSEVTQSTNATIGLKSEGRVFNHLGTEFQLRLEREVELLERGAVEQLIGCELPQGVLAVGHESRNRLSNTGGNDWEPATGLPCIWNLGMFRPTPRTLMVLPFQTGKGTTSQSEVTSDYFGPVDATRLRLDRERGLAFFRGDGRYRSKLGVGFGRAKGYLGSWTPEECRLTVVQFNLPEDAENGYCNNLWQMQAEPFRGDVVNVYNDGPNETGGCLGPFYELETLSPALGLASGEGYTHVHRTMHIVGERSDLKPIAERFFGVNIDFLELVFAGQGA